METHITTTTSNKKSVFLIWFHGYNSIVILQSETIVLFSVCLEYNLSVGNFTVITIFTYLCIELEYIHTAFLYNKNGVREVKQNTYHMEYNVVEIFFIISINN